MNWFKCEQCMNTKWESKKKTRVCEDCNINMTPLTTQKDAVAESPACNDRVMCEHLLGTFDCGLGSDVVLIYKGDGNEELMDSPDFYQFKYCANCGEMLST